MEEQEMIPMKRRTTGQEIDGYDLDGSLEHAITFLTEAFEKVPEEYRASARLDWSSGSWEGIGCFYVQYFSPETKEEMLVRTNQEGYRKLQRREQYEELKKEFG